MVRIAGAVALAAVAAGAASAQDETLALGGDVFRGGGTVEHGEAGANDVFLAGERVGLRAPISGTAHLAGRRVEAAAEVGGSVYAAGYSVAVVAPVAGSATLAGYEVEVDAPVGGSLRAFGSTVRVSAPVEGPAFLAGEEVALDAALAGDVALAAETLEFGEGATIGGRLVLYGDEDTRAQVPERVVPPDRIELRTPEGWDAGGPMHMRGPTVAEAAAGFLVGVAVLALLAWVAALIAPVGIEALRDRTALRPFATLGLGFLALSALIGASVVIALTVIGLVIAPAVLLVAVLFGLAGYVVAVYMFGAGLWEVLGRSEPDTAGERAASALIGALAACVILLVPFLGWLFVLAAVLVGMGALTAALLRRRGMAS
jgi:hypothetical protein